MYDTTKTASVLARLAILSTWVYISNVVVFGATGAGLGALVSASVAQQTSSGDALAAGAWLGGILSVFVGFSVAFMAVVWIDWAAQMLTALNRLVPVGDPSPDRVPPPMARETSQSVERSSDAAELVRVAPGTRWVC